MKTAKVLFAIVLISGLILSCNSQKLGEKSDVNLQREWMMISFKDYSKEKLMQYSAKLSFIPNLKTPNQFSAKMGCNNLFFTAKILNGNDGDEIQFSDVGSTMMYCEDMMDVESDFAKILPMMNRYKIEGHYLILVDADQNIMKFVAADWD